MADYFHVHCATHEVGGPTLRRGAGGSGLRYPDEWSNFLIEHRWCKLWLLDGSDRAAPQEYSNLALRWAVERHLFQPDGNCTCGAERPFGHRGHWYAEHLAAMYEETAYPTPDADPEE